jgi:hypothetical protein
MSFIEFMVPLYGYSKFMEYHRQEAILVITAGESFSDYGKAILRCYLEVCALLPSFIK